MARGDDVKPQDLEQLAMNPQVRLNGSIRDETLASFLDQLASVPPGDEPIAIELMTLGGDAEMGRRLALEVELARKRLQRRLIFIGKTVVYSAGTTMMGGFPVEDRYLSADAMLLIHCRKMQKTLNLDGPLKAVRTELEQVNSELESSLLLEQEGFSAIIDGSDVTLEEITEKAERGWYVPAEEAQSRRLVAGIV